MTDKKIKSLVLAIGLVVGILIAIFGGWDLLEPVVGMATLAVSITAWLSSKQVERKLGVAMEQKKFTITFGLRAGYGETAEIFSLQEAGELIQDWMKNRLEKRLPILTGMVESKTLYYPVRNGEDGSRVVSEPSGEFSGSLSPNYDKGRSDLEVVETLNDLAMYIARGLQQKRIYLSFAGKQWTLDL